MEALDPQVRIDLYRKMVLIRSYEESIRAEYHADKKPAFDIGAGQIPGEMHLSAGQEPVAAGVMAHLRHDDAVTATHRPHHLALVHGVDMNAMTAEIFGRETGLGKGRGGHMHLFDPDTHFSCSGIVAEGVPAALGQAFAFRNRGTDSIAVAVAGEGAANAGAFHEALNLAGVWQLPVIVVVEDNKWGISVPKSASTAVASNAERGAAYGMPGVHVQGNDVEAVFRAMGEAVARARGGGGPTLIEVETLRLWGHFEGDGQAYRDDLDDIESRDPISRYEATLLSEGVMDEAMASQIRTETAAQVERAVQFAKSSPLPDPAEAGRYVFAGAN